MYFDFHSMTVTTDKTEYSTRENCLHMADGACTYDIQTGKVIISGVKEGLLYITLRFCLDASEKALFLGDAFERGYGNLGWKKAEGTGWMPWYVLVHDGDKTLAAGVMTQPNALCFWRMENDLLCLDADLRAGSRSLKLGGKTLEVCTVLHREYKGSAFAALRNFCRRMCPRPRLAPTKILGGNDWYCNYGVSSDKSILLLTRRVVECTQDTGVKPYSVVDDGWELCPVSGPWRYTSRGFKDMARLAENIRREGAIPGIWMRPLMTYERLPESWFCSKKNGERFLDPSNEDVLNQVKEDVVRIISWGYRFLKHDYSTYDIFTQWVITSGAGLVKDDIVFVDDTRTTAQVIKRLYQVIRDAAGDTVINGCNTIGHLSAGIFECSRTGDDTSGREWGRTKKMGPNTLAFRMAQHNAFFAADADCVGVTRQVPWAKNRQWLDVVAQSGTPLFVSIADDCYDARIKADLTEAFRINARTQEISEPLDWMESDTPCHWRSADGTERTYQW